jgi:hypothetical protein
MDISGPGQETQEIPQRQRVSKFFPVVPAKYFVQPENIALVESA